MKESLWNLKTINDLRTPRDVFLKNHMMTTNALSGIEENTPYTIDEFTLASQKELDRRQFAKQELAIEKARKKLKNMRSKLRSIKVHNQKISKYRHELMVNRKLKESGKKVVPGLNKEEVKSLKRGLPDNSNSPFFIEY